MIYHKSTLSNGLRVLSVPMEGFKSVTLLFLVGTGSRYENRKNNGISHFLEHMVYKGTKNRPNYMDILAEIEGMGGAWNAFTSKDHTGFYIKAANTHTEQLFDILSDVLLNPLLKEEEIEKEKGVIVEEINMYEDTPMHKVAEVFDSLFFGDIPLGWDIAGTPELVRSFNRQTFTDYLDQHYAPSNMVVVAAGGVSEASKTQSFKDVKISDLAEKYLGKWEARDFHKTENIKHEQSGPRVKIKYKKTEQAHMVLGVPAYPLNSPEKYNLAMLSTVLGGGASSRLFDEVREKRGLAYYVRSAEEEYVDVGQFAVQAGVVINKTEEAVKVMLNELYLLANGTRKLEQTELTKAKELLKGHFILSLEDSKNVAGMYGTDELLEGKVRTDDEILAKIDAVTAEDVVRVARDLFKPEKLNLAIIGPFEDEEKLRKLLV
ncbi:MAG: Peptidase M16 domain protein [Candidatus Gottesmanbacteria bacterium GW2011_GWC2_39_8]|uniref:Peptidase M16 domain protein n=1 Tax=Candidatus Gottesmanbacteria bacterium GW2011_GWC2_39_8 TaxID=1618450 RepID=A0A0G0PXX7_9BACT|nr:MAG: Peptidase M16 domain protein [Candidatus Gottesmanbacteria bacterium GW2011_GWC2_39_8]